MRSYNWISLVATTVEINIVGTRARAETVPDLMTLLSKDQSLTALHPLIQKCPALLLQLSYDSGSTVILSNNNTFDKSPSTETTAFKINGHSTIFNALEYQVLQRAILSAHPVPATTAFTPTFLTSTEWSNTTGRQRAESVNQGGDTVVFANSRGVNSQPSRKLDPQILPCCDVPYTLPSPAMSTRVSISPKTTAANVHSAGPSSTSRKGFGVAGARQTGFGTAGLMVALGAAVILI